MKVVVDLIDSSIIEPRNDLLDHYFPPSPFNEEVEVIEESNEKERWQPKKWKVEYEKIVMYDLMGLKGYEIAEKMGCSKQHVYNILGTDEAQAIQQALISKIRSNNDIDIAKEIKEIQELTVQNLKTCLSDPEIFKTSRLGFISKGIDVMKGTGEHLKQAPNTQITNQFMIPPSVADRFMIGLEKADNVRLMLAEKNKGRDVTNLTENNESAA